MIPFKVVCIHSHTVPIQLVFLNSYMDISVDYVLKGVLIQVNFGEVSIDGSRDVQILLNKFP